MSQNDKKFCDMANAILYLFSCRKLCDMSVTFATPMLFHAISFCDILKVTDMRYRHVGNVSDTKKRCFHLRILKIIFLQRELGQLILLKYTFLVVVYPYFRKKHLYKRKIWKKVDEKLVDNKQAVLYIQEQHKN